MIDIDLPMLKLVSPLKPVQIKVESHNNDAPELWTIVPPVAKDCGCNHSCGCKELDNIEESE